MVPVYTGALILLYCETPVEAHHAVRISTIIRVCEGISADFPRSLARATIRRFLDSADDLLGSALFKTLRVIYT